MSYKHILRRVNRILQSNINEVVSRLTREEEELREFDEQLRQHDESRSSARSEGTDARTNPSAGTRKGASASSSAQNSTRGGERQHRQSSSDRRSQQHGTTEGKRKPGEKDDAYYFAVLGLTPAARVDEIKRAYKRLMSTYHPDRVASLEADKQARAAEKAKAINEAYQIIRRRRNFT